MASAARRAIMRRGIDATLREIAREGGFTTGLVTHYFPDKRAVLVGAFAAASQDFIGGVRQRFATVPDGPPLLAELLDAALPASRRQQAEWRLWAEMWAYAGRDPEFGAVIESTDMLWVQELEAALRRLASSKLIRRECAVREQALILARLIDGLGLRAWLSGDWSSARRLLVAHLQTLGLPAEVAAALPTGGRRRAAAKKPTAG